MLIKHKQGSFLKCSVPDGVNISVGDAVSVVGNSATLADSTTKKETIGLAKSVNGAIVYIQTKGLFPLVGSDEEYWLGNNGSLVTDVPQDGMIQQVAKRIDSDNILIDIDKTVIIL